MTWRRSLACLAVAAALATACSPGASPASPTGGAVGSVPVGSTARPVLPGGSGGTGSSAGTGASAAPTFAGTPFPPRLTLTLEEALGPILSPNNGPEGYAYALPAAGARADDGTFVLFVAWFGALAGEVIVTVARSDDARAWTVDHDPIYTDLGLTLADPGPIPSEALQLDDGTWVLYGWGSSEADPNEISSWRASAPEPEGPWTLDEARVLEPGDAAGWDSQAVSIGSVARRGGEWLAWYEGQPPGSEARGDIGFATSADGLAWTKRSEPVIGRGICGEGTRLAVQQPQVEALGGGFVGLFGAYRAPRTPMAVYGATTEDGEQWECASLAPLVRDADIPSSRGIHTIASIPLDDETIGVFIESLSLDRSEIWLATLTAVDEGP